MLQVGADTGAIDSLLDLLARDTPVETALARCGAPLAAVAFTGRTLELATDGMPHILGAEFAFGREEAIPVMFRSIARIMEVDESLQLFRVYLERHVTVDEGIHAQLAMQMLDELVDDDEQKREEVIQAGVDALRARIEMWDSAVVVLRAQAA